MANRIYLSADVFKISKPGKDVLTTDNPDNLIFSTDFLGVAISRASGAFSLSDGNLQSSWKHGACAPVMVFPTVGTLGAGYRPLTYGPQYHVDGGDYYPTLIVYSDEDRTYVRRAPKNSGINLRGSIVTVRV